MVKWLLRLLYLLAVLSLVALEYTNEWAWLYVCCGACLLVAVIVYVDYYRTFMSPQRLQRL